MAFRGNLNIIRVESQAELSEIAIERNSVKVGSTIDPQIRADQLERDGYSGTMYWVKTTNMQYAVNKLLEHCPRHNKQEHSNAPNDAGYVYVIKGKKYKKC